MCFGCFYKFLFLYVCGCRVYVCVFYVLLGCELKATGNPTENPAPTVVSKRRCRAELGPKHTQKITTNKQR